MKTLILSCPTLKGELESALHEHGTHVRVKYMPTTLHENMHSIRPTLQKIIDKNKIYDRIVILLSGCGGSTAGIKATTAEVIIPKTHDCLDILLSKRDTCEVESRDPVGIYMTGSWYEYHMKTLLNADKMIAELGYETAAAELRSIFRTFNKFYIIDTAVFDVAEVRQGLATMIKMLNGSLTIVSGEFGILHRVAADEFNPNCFHIVPKGGTVPQMPFKFE